MRVGCRITTDTCPTLRGVTRSMYPLLLKDGLMIPYVISFPWFLSITLSRDGLAKLTPAVRMGVVVRDGARCWWWWWWWRWVTSGAVAQHAQGVSCSPRCCCWTCVCMGWCLLALWPVFAAGRRRRPRLRCVHPGTSAPALPRPWRRRHLCLQLRHVCARVVRRQLHVAGASPGAPCATWACCQLLQCQQHQQQLQRNQRQQWGHVHGCRSRAGPQSQRAGPRRQAQARMTSSVVRSCSHGCVPAPRVRSYMHCNC